MFRPHLPKLFDHQPLAVARHSMEEQQQSEAGCDLGTQLASGRYVDVLSSAAAAQLISEAVQQLDVGNGVASPDTGRPGLFTKVAVAVAAFNAFLQCNVTGPVLRDVCRVERLFARDDQQLAKLRKQFLRRLDVDGVSVYPYTPHIELFCLARYILTSLSPECSGSRLAPISGTDDEHGELAPSVGWLLLRLHAWHFRLLTQPSLGSGSIFGRSSQWSEVPSLREEVERRLTEAEAELLHGEARHSQSERVSFLLEAANIHMMLGAEKKAREAVARAAEENLFVYALSGARGKRTRFQEKSTSQLVVLARNLSDDNEKASGNDQGSVRPEALRLNDDTLLEEIHFTKDEQPVPEPEPDSTMHPALRGMSPDQQPQLSSLDQIVLLTEATIKDTFAPTDTLTSEEILPFAARVLADTSTNWQVYTQALLVRSRIELHRSRTLERGVLQMQAVVDQVVADQAVGDATGPDRQDESGVPSIRVSAPASFFPAPKETESAPARARLRYVHALGSPPRWHLESELASAWAGVGSLVSALDIFRRLRLWAEMALCLAASAAHDDPDGRGMDGEEKARAVLRWRLFYGTDHGPSADDEDVDVDVDSLKGSDFAGPERVPPPPNAPRLWCILGDLDNSPACYTRAWETSGRRYARAQKSLGEYYLRQKDWTKARDAYRLATAVNRTSADMWSRLGDIDLRLANLDDAAESFARAIATADGVSRGEDARTWSNLGSVYWTMYLERAKQGSNKVDVDGPPRDKGKDGPALLAASLSAFKRGAALSYDNWRIWDNVVTVGSRVRPMAVNDVVLGLRRVLDVRKTEDALDLDVLRLLVNEVLLCSPVELAEGIHEPARASPQRAVVDLLEDVVACLITRRAELWEVLLRERAWRRDYAGAVDAAEKGWRAAVGGTGWLEDEKEWLGVVERTDDLVSALQNYGPMVPGLEHGWKAKARSAVRSVLAKTRDAWEGSEGWVRLQGLLEGLKTK